MKRRVRREEEPFAQNVSYAANRFAVSLIGGSAGLKSRPAKAAGAEVAVKRKNGTPL